jgi:hypothetical protein
MMTTHHLSWWFQRLQKKKTHMTTICACHLGFGNGEIERKTTMMSIVLVLMVSDVAT